MDAEKRKRLEAKGWKLGGYADFLGMTEAERAVVETRLAAWRAVERLRADSGLTQAELARRMGMKRPNVSRFLRDPESATLDTYARALVALGRPPQSVVAAFG